MLDVYYRKRSDDNRCDVFRSKGFAPDLRLRTEQGSEIGLHQLPAFLRTLLVTDGTVTKSLEAYYWEPVAVTGLTQRVAETESPIVWLDVQAGCPVLTRYVQLTAKHGGRHFANAFSIIRLNLLADDLRLRLLNGTLGIGELIRSCGLETFREVLEIGFTRDFSLGGEYQGPEQECVFRTYRITLGGDPAMLVSEYFPVELYA